MRTFPVIAAALLFSGCFVFSPDPCEDRCKDYDRRVELYKDQLEGGSLKYEDFTRKLYALREEYSDCDCD